MKKLFAILAASFIAIPAQAGGSSFLESFVPNQYVLQEHNGLNPEIWEYEQPLRTVVHHSEPKKCEDKERCVELDIVLEGPGGHTYYPTGMDHKALVFEPNAILQTSTIKIQCNEKATPFKINYPHIVRTWHRDPVHGGRTHSTPELYSHYTVSTYEFQKEMCKYSFSKERRQAIEVLDTLACAFDPKKCKK